MYSLEEIEKIITLFTSNQLSQLELGDRDFYLKLKSEVAEEGQVKVPTLQPIQPVLEVEKEPEIKEVSKGIPVLSPMVGTFYRASDPSAEPFVKIGDVIQKGQKLCIIEAMKLMNEIQAESDGVLLEILAEDGKLVEYGQALFVIG